MKEIANFVKLGVAFVAMALLTACVVDSDAPTPSRVVVATPGGCRSPQPTLPEAPNERLLPLEVTLSPTTPKSAIVIGGRDKPVLFTRYRVKNPNAVPLRLTGAVVSQTSPNGDMADFRKISVETDTWHGPTVTPYAASSDFAFDFSWSPPLDVPAMSEIEFRILGWMSNVLPSSAVGGAWHGVPRSGHTPSLELSRLTTDQVGIARIVPHTAPIMVLRKSEPIVTVPPLSSTTLANIDQDLLKFRIDGEIAWKQIRVSWVKGPNPDLRVVNIRVRRGSTDMDSSVYAVYSDDITGPDSNGSFAIRFKEGYEAAVSGGVYTVHGTVTGVNAGSYLKLSFDTSDTTVATSGLAFTEPPADYMLADDGSSRGFIWSDLSEVPHAALIKKHGGSLDWTNGYLVPGLSGSAVTLSL